MKTRSAWSGFFIFAKCNRLAKIHKKNMRKFSIIDIAFFMQ